MGHDVDVHIDGHIANPGDAFGCGNEGLAQVCNLALGGVAEFNVEGHIAIGHGQVLHRFGRDKILAGIRVDHGLEGLIDRLHCHSHSSSPKDGHSLANLGRPTASASIPLGRRVITG
jgi:hypothetical protein